MTAVEPNHVQVLQLPDCPLVELLRSRLEDCLRRTDLHPVVETLTGPYPSPTLVIDGVDVATGGRPSERTCCRLDLPSSTQIIAALQKGVTR